MIYVNKEANCALKLSDKLEVFNFSSKFGARVQLM